MTVQVQVTWRVVSDDELEITSAFGQLVTSEGEGEGEASAAPIDRVLAPESSTVASGLALQIA